MASDTETFELVREHVEGAERKLKEARSHAGGSLRVDLFNAIDRLRKAIAAIDDQYTDR